MISAREVSSILLSEQPLELIQIVKDRFLVDLSLDDARSIQSKAAILFQENEDRDWSGWIIWLKNRLSIGFGQKKNELFIEYQTAVLHIFFFRIEENDQMLSRLDGEKYKAKTQVARSKISKYQSEITPIDSTASKVAPKGDAQ